MNKEYSCEVIDYISEILTLTGGQPWGLVLYGSVGICEELVNEETKPEGDFSRGWTYFVHHGIHPGFLSTIS